MAILIIVITLMFMPLCLWLSDHSTQIGKLRKEIEEIHKTLTREDAEEDRED